MKDYTEKVRQLVDNIKTICANNGLGGDANEYKIVTQSFLYKFLNDKFLYETKLSYNNLKNLTENDYELLLLNLGNKTAHLKPQHLLSYTPTKHRIKFSWHDDYLKWIYSFGNAQWG